MGRPFSFVPSGSEAPEFLPVWTHLFGWRGEAIELGLEVEHQLLAFAFVEPFGPIGKHGGVGAQLAGIPRERGRGARLGEHGEHPAADDIGGELDRRADRHRLAEQIALLGHVAEQIIHAAD